MSEVYNYELQLDLDDYEDLELRAFGAILQADIKYSIRDVVRADTPKGACMGQEIVIHSIDDAALFPTDQDGGELPERPMDGSEVYDYISEDNLIELIRSTQ